MPARSPGPAGPAIDSGAGKARALRKRSMANLLRMGHCAPAVMQTLLDASEIDAPWLVKLAAGLPGGIGNTGGECGGVTAPLILLGLRHGLEPDDDPGTYNARRDNLEGFWRGLFGYSHGVLVVNAFSFYENVNRHRVEGRELQPGENVENVVLEFRPRPTQDMLVACLWSRWIAPGEDDLLSFAAITDEPPPEVAAAGHDRCTIPIRAENVDAWLNPGPRRLDTLYAILDDRERPYYEHRLAA